MPELDPSEFPPVVPRRVVRKPGQAKLREFTLRCPLVLHLALICYCRETGVSMAYGIRKLVAEGLGRRGYYTAEEGVEQDERLKLDPNSKAR